MVVVVVVVVVVGERGGERKKLLPILILGILRARESPAKENCSKRV